MAVFAYFNMDKMAPKVKVVAKELNASKLKILTEKDLETLPKKAPSAANNFSQADSGCYKWGNFSSTNIATAQVILVNLGLQADVNQESVQKQDRRFWIYYPPFRTAALAQQKADEIKALGVDELHIVQDSQWRHAISFGLFAEEAHAITLLRQLKSKGVKNAKKSLRNQGKALASLLVKDVNAEAALMLYKIQPEFVGTSVTPVTCPV